MTVLHGWVSELTSKWKEDHPLLDLLKDASVGVASLVDLHFLKRLKELLDGVLHVIGLNLLPRSLEVSLEDILAVANVVPESFNGSKLDLNLLNLTLGGVHELRLSKLLGCEAKLVHVVLEGLDVVLDTLDLHHGLLLASIVLVEFLLLQVSDVALELLLELADDLDVLLRLVFNKRLNLFASLSSELLQVGPVVEQLLGVLGFLVFANAVARQVVESFLELVKSESNV